MENTPQSEIERRFHTMVSAAVDGIITIDQYGIVEGVNPAACKLFGYDAEEMKGRSVNYLMPSPYRSEHDGYLERYLQTGQARIIGIGREVQGLRKDHTTFPFWLSVSELRLEGRIIFTGFVHDISALKEAQAEVLSMNIQLEHKVSERTEQLAEVVNQLLATNKNLEREIKERLAAEHALHQKQAELVRAIERERELNDLKSRFVSMASHEFRTPLSTILSSAALTKRYAEQGNQEKQDYHILKIKQAVNHLTGILNDFLSLTKLEEGKIEFNPERIQLYAFCQDVIEEMRGLAKPGQEVRMEGLDSDIQFVSDPRILKNILYNLISNALKYSDKDVHCSVLKQAEQIQISIRDEGIGIPLHDQQHLFERFFRATNATNIQGTGLGLNIIRRYADLLDAQISFVSTEGVGSTFTVLIPIGL